MKLWKTISVNLVIALSILSTVCGFKILIVPALQGGHVLQCLSFSKQLSQKGHQVHMILTEKLSEVHKKTLQTSNIYPQVVTRREGDLGAEEIDEERMNEFFSGMSNPIGLLRTMKEIFQNECSSILLHNEQLMLQLEKQKFDAAVVDGIFFLKCYYLIPHRLHIPFVSFSEALEPWLFRLPYLPSFVPLKISPLSDKLNFFERVQNIVAYFGFYFLTRYVGPTDEVLTEYQKYGQFRSLDDIAKKSLLFITSSTPALDYSLPTMPNVINLAGLTQKEPSDLSQELKSIIDSAPNGVILMTFGSLLTTLPKATVEEFVSAFKSLNKYKILWKFNNTLNLEIPPNIHIASWLPQNDILAHKNTKLFITHCGANGQTEAVYHGVPMLGFPLFGDQHYNAKRAVYRKYGKEMNILSFTREELIQNVKEIIEDSSYKENISLASKILRDQPLSADKLAAHWIEHVIKYGGEYLRSAGDELSLFQYYMLDIVLGFIVLIIVLTYLIICLCRSVSRSCRAKNKQKDE